MVVRECHVESFHLESLENLMDHGLAVVAQTRLFVQVLQSLAPSSVVPRDVVGSQVRRIHYQPDFAGEACLCDPSLESQSLAFLLVGQFLSCCLRGQCSFCHLLVGLYVSFFSIV